MEATFTPLLSKVSGNPTSPSSSSTDDLPAGVLPYEDFDFAPYLQEVKTEEDLRKTWRVFTKMKDVLETGRRLENFSWRLWFAKRSQGETLDEEELVKDLTQLEKYDLDLQRDLQRMRQSTEGVLTNIFTDQEKKRFEEQERREQLRLLLEHLERLKAIKEEHSLPDDALDKILNLVDDAFGEMADAAAAAQQQQQQQISLDRKAPRVVRLPRSYADVLETLERIRAELALIPSCVAFGHSLERNGANNFLLYLLRELVDSFIFTLVVPKDGPMREDFEALGCRVELLETTAESFADHVNKLVSSHSFLIANTIMRAEAVIAAAKHGTPSIWMIHEAWPQDQFDYYAKQVFQMAHVDGDLIRQGFATASRIVFPAHVQKQCYAGLFEPHRSQVIYNGIPLSAINSYRSTQNRDRVRAELGYQPTDRLVVHLGTICKRKGQIYTARAFSLLRNDPEIQQSGYMCKLLMVGARFIRDHEIAYQQEIKAELEAAGAIRDCTILEIQKNVLPYYLAADILVVPSLNEVLPLVVCEAMAFERPVVASAIDGIPEAISDGVEGFLVPPADEQSLYERVKQLILDENLRTVMGKNGRKRVLGQFSFSAMANNYRQVIQDALKDKPSAAAAALEAA
jgi:glycosyltransferase involved in cell wall biosynthesis